MARSLKGQFHTEHLRDENLEDLRQQFAGLAADVKVGKFVVEAEKTSDFTLDISPPSNGGVAVEQLMTIAIKPAVRNSNAPVRSMVFDFDYIGETRITFEIEKADGTRLVYNKSYGTMDVEVTGFLCEIYKLGSAQIAAEESRADEKNNALVRESVNLTEKSTQRASSSRKVTLGPGNLATLDRQFAELADQIRSYGYMIKADEGDGYSAFETLNVAIKPSRWNADTSIASMMFKFTGAPPAGCATGFNEFTIKTADGRAFSYHEPNDITSPFLEQVRELSRDPAIEAGRPAAEAAYRAREKARLAAIGNHQNAVGNHQQLNKRGAGYKPRIIGL